MPADGVAQPVWLLDDRSVRNLEPLAANADSIVIALGVLLDFFRLEAISGRVAPAPRVIGQPLDPPFDLR